MTLTIVFFFSVTLHYLQSKINYNQRIKKNPSKDYAIQFKEEGLK